MFPKILEMIGESETIPALEPPEIIKSSAGRKTSFHWRLLQGGEIAGRTRSGAALLRETGKADLEAQIEFCRLAEACGIRGLLIDVGAAKPDPIILASALGPATEKIEFIIAYRSGFMPPTTFVQQINTLSGMIDGRIILNIVAGHSPQEQRYYGDFLSRPKRYARTAEFLAICRAFWKDEPPVNFDGEYYRVSGGRLNASFESKSRKFPEIFIGGGSDSARDLALSQGTLWMQMADAPEVLAPRIAPVIAAGRAVGLRMSLIARPTKDEAVRAACQLVDNLEPSRREREREELFVRRSDSVSIRTNYEEARRLEWVTPWLWTGAVRTHGPAAVAMVGDPQELADAFIAYRKIGVSQFILSGWPKRDAMIFFGKEILPRIREREKKLGAIRSHVARERGDVLESR